MDNYKERKCDIIDCKYYNGLFGRCKLLTDNQRPCIQNIDIRLSDNLHLMAEIDNAMWL